MQALNLVKVFQLLFVTTAVFSEPITNDQNDETSKTIDSTTMQSIKDKEREDQILQAQAINVRDRYSETASLMCADDVLCAMDPAVTGAVSVDLREKEEGSDEMTSKGVESMCRCVMEENLDIGTLYEKIRRVCGDGASSNWMSPEKNGKGKKLLMSWASKRVDEACGRITDEKSVTPPCPWNYAAKRVGQRKMMGVLGYSNDLVCSWRLHGWKVPPNNDEGVAQTLLRHQLEPLQETVKSQLQSNN